MMKQNYRVNIANMLLLTSLTIMMASCAAPKEITYFQDLYSETKELIITEPVEITIRPKDKLSILVNSQDPRLTNLFNLPILSQQIGNDNNYAQSRGMSGYTVDMSGNIDFPILGKININGMTREEVAVYIKNELESKDLIKDPVVTVEFMNLSISVLGEVNRPGKYNITRDNFTVLDALSMAGDLTIFGNRTNILVLRQVDGVQRVHVIDLNSAQRTYSSPVYYLQQGDVVYVEPNDTRKRQSTVNGNNIRSTSFWISIASLLTSIAILFVK